jgi:hypothetical protein
VAARPVTRCTARPRHRSTLFGETFAPVGGHVSVYIMARRSCSPEGRALRPPPPPAAPPRWRLEPLAGGPPGKMRSSPWPRAPPPPAPACAHTPHMEFELFQGVQTKQVDSSNAHLFKAFFSTSAQQFTARTPWRSQPRAPAACSSPAGHERLSSPPAVPPMRPRAEPGPPYLERRAGHCVPS